MISSFRVVVVLRLLAFAAALLQPASSSAHVVYDRRLLRQWAQEADVIVLAQFRTGMQVWRADDGSDMQEFFNVRVLETLRGTASNSLDFFAHAEGEPRWRPGDLAVLFLDRTAEHAGVARVAQRFPLFTVQGAGQEWTLPPATRDEVVSVVRHWSAASLPLPADAMRAALLRELTATDARLHADALAELAYADCSPALFPEPSTVEPFANLLSTAALTVPNRVALARVLDGCPGFETAAALQRLTEQPLNPRERTALIRAAGLTDDSTLGAWLEGLLQDPDPFVRREAIAALGNPRHHAHVAALTRAATAPGDATAVAAVRALAAIGTPEAVSALTALTKSAQPEVANTARAYLTRAAPTGRP